MVLEGPGYSNLRSLRRGRTVFAFFLVSYNTVRYIRLMGIIVG